MNLVNELQVLDFEGQEVIDSRDIARYRLDLAKEKL